MSHALWPIKTFIIFSIFGSISSCAPRYVSDEVSAQRLQKMIDESRDSVIAALAGGNGPITLHGIDGIKDALVEVRILPQGICGRIIKERAVYADWTTQTVDYGDPENDAVRRERQRCVRFENFHRATPGSF